MGNLSSVKKTDINEYCLKQSIYQKIAGCDLTGRKDYFANMREPDVPLLWIKRWIQVLTSYAFSSIKLHTFLQAVYQQ